MVERIQTYSLDEIKKGGDKVFKELYLEVRPLFLNYAKRFHLQDEDLKDIYQDSFMVFYRNVMSGKLTELTSSVSTYVISIGKYNVLSFIRKNKKIVENELAIEFATDDEKVVENLVMERSEMSEEQKLLYVHFKHLGAKCREILTNFYFNGFTISEIKEIGQYNSENVVKSQKSRCLKTLKELIFK